MAVIDAEENDNNNTLVKGYEKREWLADILDNLIIETLNADYEDIDSLHNVIYMLLIRCAMCKTS